MAKGSLSPALFLAVFLFFSEAVAATAENETDKVTASVITSSEKVNPTQDIDVLIRLQMHDDWHTYWSNPGDAGLSTQVKWQLPEGYVVEEPVLSRPQKFMFDGLVQYGYGDVAYLRTKIKPQPESLPEGSRKYFSAVVSWLACKDVCVPETVKLNFMLPVTNRLTEISQEWAAEAAAAKPRFSYRPDWKALYEVKDGNRLLINIDSRGFDFAENVKKILFIPHQKDIIVNTAEQTAGYDGNGRLSLEIPLENGDFDELSGVLLLEYADGDTGYELTLEAGKNLDVYEPIDYDTRGLWLVMLMAFAGGLILNLMPCIFPILTIKVISLAQSPYNKYKARVESLLYFFGVVSSFFLIATILVWLRSTGEQIGWGFQLQSPVFVGVMIVIFTIIFLMLLDIVSLRNPFAGRVGRISFRRQKINAFMTGFFAVLIASPCTGPFMGIAIGYTLAKPIYVYYPVFLALSVGYALPFALAGLFPKFIHRFLPKPGKWMDILKKIFAIPVFLTIMWLFWVLFSQIEANRGEKVREVLWRTYNRDIVAQAVASGEKVFIDFTAKWCITCLANEKIALQSKEFERLVRTGKIQAFKADWTSRSAEIAQSLAYYGRNSIPLYVYYNGEGGNYVILPQLLTPGILENYLK